VLPSFVFQKSARAPSPCQHTAVRCGERGRPCLVHCVRIGAQTHELGDRARVAAVCCLQNRSVATLLTTRSSRMSAGGRNARSNANQPACPPRPRRGGILLLRRPTPLLPSAARSHRLGAAHCYGQRASRAPQSTAAPAPSALLARPPWLRCVARAMVGQAFDRSLAARATEAMRIEGRQRPQYRGRNQVLSTHRRLS
jgi:hypothetical protein